MSQYEPPFTNPAVIDVARRRGLIDEHETIADGIDRVVRALAYHDHRMAGAAGTGFASELRAALSAGRIAVSSQVMAAAGRDSSVAACTVLPTTGTDDTSRLRRLIAEVSVSSRAGMGCGVDLSDFDDPAFAVLEINRAAVLINRDLVEQSVRPPALMVTCSAAHPGAAKFAAAKEGADLSEWVANISLRFNGDDDMWTQLRPTLARLAHGNGEPGVLFQHIADADNPTPEFPLTSTAPCAEVFLAEGERCVFVTVNLAAHVRGRHMDWRRLADSVGLAVRAADAAVEMAMIGAESVVASRRRIGIGICGFHSALIMMGIPYANAAPIARTIAERLTYHAHSASAQLAADRGPFPSWSGSRWRDPEWLNRKAQHRSGAIDDRCWSALHSRIERTGVRHAAVVAYPPTGVVAEVLGVSRSYEPHFSLAGRTGVASRRSLQVAPEVAGALFGRPEEAGLLAQILNSDTGHQIADAGHTDLLACARQLTAESHLAVHAAFSLLADEAGSKTVNLPHRATIAEVEALLETSRTLGLKGVTVFRDGCLNEMENL